MGADCIGHACCCATVIQLVAPRAHRRRQPQFALATYVARARHLAAETLAATYVARARQLAAVCMLLGAVCIGRAAAWLLGALLGMLFWTRTRYSEKAGAPHTRSLEAKVRRRERHSEAA